MTEADMKLLSAIFREARLLIDDCCVDDDIDATPLERALDNFDLRASFQVPIA
jgi:hypothetical protein